MVPNDAVERGPNGLYAFVIDDANKVEMHDIKVSQEGTDQSVVTQGLSAGKRSWSAGQYRLQARRHGRTESTPLRLARAAQRGAERTPAKGALIMEGGISAPFIRHPIATSLLMVGVLFVGLVAYPRLPVAPLPQVDFPTIQVSASLPGASPDTMASSVASRSRRNSPRFRASRR